jgi:hypothetical protein
MLRYTIAFVVFATCNSVDTVSASAQEASSPKSPGQIAAASKALAQKYEDCRLQAKQRQLRFLKRRNFIHGCVRKHL